MEKEKLAEEIQGVSQKPTKEQILRRSRYIESFIQLILINISSYLILFCVGDAAGNKTNKSPVPTELDF